MFLLSRVGVSKRFTRSISRGVYRLSEITFATQASKMWSFRMINLASGLFFSCFDSIFSIYRWIYISGVFNSSMLKIPHMDLRLEPVNDKYATCLPRHLFAPFTNQQF